MSRIVERLRKNGLLTRIPKNIDRRAVDIKLTEKGLVLLKKIDTEIVYFYEPIKNLKPEDSNLLSTLLDRFMSEIVSLEEQSV
jgi:MarR family transcriptional regulator, multiple gene regulator MgrA